MSFVQPALVLSRRRFFQALAASALAAAVPLPVGFPREEHPVDQYYTGRMMVITAGVHQGEFYPIVSYVDGYCHLANGWNVKAATATGYAPNAVSTFLIV